LSFSISEQEVHRVLNAILSVGYAFSQKIAPLVLAIFLPYLVDREA